MSAKPLESLRSNALVIGSTFSFWVCHLVVPPADSLSCIGLHLLLYCVVGGCPTSRSALQCWTNPTFLQALAQVVASPLCTLFQARPLRSRLSMTRVVPPSFTLNFTPSTRCICTAMTLRVFAISRAIAFHDSETDELVHFPPSPPTDGRPRDARPLVNTRVFTYHGFSSATYVMDRAHLLPIEIRRLVRELFYGPRAISLNIEPPRMCRLYFGKVIGPSQFINATDFPIDVERYSPLYTLSSTTAR